MPLLELTRSTLSPTTDAIGKEIDAALWIKKRDTAPLLTPIEECRYHGQAIRIEARCQRRERGKGDPFLNLLNYPHDSIF